MASLGQSFALSALPVAAAEKRVDAPDVQLRDAMLECGIVPPAELYLDGKIHRFNPGHGSKSSKSGWYVAYCDGVPAGSFGDYSMGLTQTWVADIGREINRDEMAQMRARMEQARVEREAELARTRAEVAESVSIIWNTCEPASAAHPYLEAKKVKPHGLRMTHDDRLVLPIRDVQGELMSLQYIDTVGTKMMQKGGAKAGGMVMLGSPRPGDRIYVAEGFATAATVHETMGSCTVAAIDAGNVGNVVAALRERFGLTQELVIVADNDRSGTGQVYAAEAAIKHSANVYMPPCMGDDANDFAMTRNGDLRGLLTSMPLNPSKLQRLGLYLAEQHKLRLADPALADNLSRHTDLTALTGPDNGEEPWLTRVEPVDGEPAAVMLPISTPIESDWLVQADDFSVQPAPLPWLVKNWLQDKALIMIHGPSGGGKTFVVLDLCLHIASGKEEWYGNRVSAGGVVYLAGEGHHGLRSRVAAWKAKHAPTERLNLWMSKSGCDLNTPAGYSMIRDHIRTLPQRPRMIVVDTLHRFLAGDENSSQDAKVMLDACAGLMHEFECSVLLVHHTGVSEEAQTRARGSSAWRGALDIEISVVPAKKDKPLELIQRKSKDAEQADNMYFNLESVEIPGWYDADGEAVTSAVIVPTTAPLKAATAGSPGVSKTATFKKIIEAAWWKTGAEARNAKPYISRAGLMNYLIENNGYSEATAKQHTKPAADGKLICELLVSEVIKAYEHGWVVTDPALGSSLLMRKSTETVPDTDI